MPGGGTDTAPDWTPLSERGGETEFWGGDKATWILALSHTTLLTLL